MERKTISITGLGEFQYTEKLLALAMQRTKADLYQDAADRKLYGRSTMSKEQLAIAAVDLHLREQDDAENERALLAREQAAKAWDVDRAIDELCPHGIDAGRRCSICGEDAKRETVGLKPMRNPFALSYPAAFGWVITEGHVKYCAEFGHTTLKTDGVLSAMCPRCGENVHEVPVGVPKVTCARQWRDGDIYRTCDVVVSSHEQPTHEGPCFDAVRCVWDAAAAERYPAVAEQVELVRCGRSWRGLSGARLTCDVLATRDQVDRSGGGYSKPASGPAHEGPCFDAFRKQWDADAAARYHDAPKAEPPIDWDAVNRAARGFIRELLGSGYIPEYYQDFADELTALIKDAVRQQPVKNMTQDLEAARSKLHSLRCALAELVGRWSAEGPTSTWWSAAVVLNETLTDHR